MLTRAALFLCLEISLLSGICAADAASSLPSLVENQNHTAAGRLDHGVLTLRLELRRGLWHPDAADGRAIEVMAFSEEGGPLQTPAPLIRVPQRTEIHATVHNALTEKTFVHGLHQHPAKVDDCLELAPGETKEIRFLAGERGTYLYWAATSKGTIEGRFREDTLMSGAFIVDAPDSTVSDRVMVIQLWAKDLYRPTFDGVLSINGKSWPYTERLNAQLGEAEHWRVLNATPLPHPMHLHGFYFRVDSVGDGDADHHYTEAERRMAVTELVPSGHTFEMTWVPERAGSWVFHCHILDHMMRSYKAPWLYGPGGPPANMQHSQSDDDGMAVGMGDLVMGIHVADNKAHLVPASAAVPPPAAHKDLFVRERKQSPYVPAGPGFYLQGVSTEVGAIGPPLVVTRGERTAITVHNELNEPTAIHWHGIEIESYYDGVPGWTGTPQRTTPYIKPGESFVAYMTPPRAGTFIYHTHWHDVNQLTSGMYGALIVLEQEKKYDPATDKVFVLGRGGINEMKDPMLVNGSAQPGTMVLLNGHTYRLRFVNITPNDREVDTSIRLNGHPIQWRALAKDGAALPPQQATMRDAVQVISVGETYDFEFSPKEPGGYELRFCSDFGTTVTQMITVVPSESPFSVFAENR